ncbi:hypothetical protein Tco_0822988 [Tanacetum coccineum]|uniref:Uncharacterized protein n=1 Tax=Tanacetum coccineum TaxID=301880 RepID=A0ABQ5AIF8_9ASTR
MEATTMVLGCCLCASEGQGNRKENEVIVQGSLSIFLTLYAEPEHREQAKSAERARISAINLDDYQLDPLTPPPSPSSPFTMAAYQRMIAETDPTQREEALTETGQNSVPVPETALTVCTTRLRGQLHTILEDMDRYPNACLEELEAFMTLWDVKPRVEESSLEALSVDELITQLRQLCEDAEDRASNAQEEARQKRKEALEEVVQQIYRTNN